MGNILTSITNTPSFEEHLKQLRKCQRCVLQLPLGAKPIVQLSKTAKILIIGQAPGRKAHNSGLPFNDPSGDRLRSWLNMTSAQFYDEKEIAIMPMGFCYPGENPKGGDLPPLAVCAPLWHAKTLGYLNNVQLTLLVGQYAQAYYLGKERKKTLTETVKTWRDYQPFYFPLPHPSWRNTGWIKAHPWFQEDVLPALEEKVWSILRPE